MELIVNPNSGHESKQRAYKLIHEGILALADVHNNGIRIDTEYVHAKMERMTQRIREIREKLNKSKIVKKWKEVYGSKFNLSSNPQLADILFNQMGYECTKRTKTGNPATDQESLESLDIPMVKGLLLMRKTKKARDTYLSGIMRETVDGYLHPSFKLHTVATFRSSCTDPNFQNMPIRDPAMGKLIRSAILPHPGQMLVEIDYSGIEVRIAACYHKDTTMLSYINDPTKDMHRDMAAQCYCLPTSQVTKDTRYCGKNKFVFPEFYGDWWQSCATSLWDAVRLMNLKKVDGVHLIDHLRRTTVSAEIPVISPYPDEPPSWKPSRVTLDNVNSFSHHIRMVEKDFWYNRFSEYAAWKNKHYNEYLDRGHVDMLTGFRCSGEMKRNEVVNYPVQGAAFHCLLWSLTQVNKWLKETGKKTKVVGQIHDSLILSMEPEEQDEVLPMCKQIMCEDLRKEWPWIITPLDIEAEATPIDGNWYQKKEIEL